MEPRTLPICYAAETHDIKGLRQREMPFWVGHHSHDWPTNLRLPGYWAMLAVSTPPDEDSACLRVGSSLASVWHSGDSIHPSLDLGDSILTFAQDHGCTQTFLLTEFQAS